MSEVRQMEKNTGKELVLYNSKSSYNKSKKPKGKKNRPLVASAARAIHEFAVHIKKMKLLGTPTSQVIPYGFPSFMKGTQNPVIRLKLFQQLISITLSTAYTTVIAISGGAFTNLTDFSSIFDEYRILRGELQYWQALQTSASGSLAANGLGGACIDYANSAALGSFDAMQSHDTAKLFNWYGSPGNNHKSGEPAARWPMLFEPLPDEDWISTGTTGTIFCYWKPYLSTAQAAQTSTPGYVLGWADFQFRGIAA